MKLFMNQYVSLYGEEHQTYTFHAVVNHLVDDAALHGSLSQHSMFSLESTLGTFKNYIKGNRGVPSQFIKGKKHDTSILYCNSHKLFIFFILSNT